MSTYCPQWKRKHKGRQEAANQQHRSLREQYRTEEGWSCTRKVRHTPETAAVYWGKLREPNMGIYMCQYCSFLHFGHVSKNKT